MADIVERYPAGSSTANYTGNDLTDVQTHSGAATGDVIKVSQNITVSTTIGNGASTGYSVGSFTLQGASSENPVTISGGTRLYNLPNTVTSFTLKDVTISGFKNTEQYGGAFFTNGVTTVYAENVTFSNNKSYRGGVFGNNDFKLSLYGNNIVFDSNQAAGHPQNYDYGGAIRGDIAIYGKTSESIIKFINNSATDWGGAITAVGSEGIISSGQFTFDSNNAKNGGAIYASCSLTFSGNGSSATFTNNVAAQNGNDIILQSQTTILTFKDAGNYSFDGGIYLENANQKTIIDEAQVTIAGRENDTTNNYVLRSVTISNGGKLTANLDNIDKIENTTITLNGTESQVELYNALLNQVASIKSDTGAGTFDLEYSAANGAVQNESLVISSGRIDVKGYMEAAIRVGSDATFSPGNSVGHVETTEDFTLDGGTLLIEMDENGIDTMTANSFDLTNGTISFTLTDDIPWGSSYDILTATSGEAFDEGIIDRILNGQTLPDYFSLALAGDTNNIVRFSIDRNAVPEPSTWALLALGVVVLFLRKRVRN